MPTTYHFRTGIDAWAFRILFTAVPAWYLIGALQGRAFSLVTMLLVGLLSLLIWSFTSIRLILTDDELIIRGLWRRRLPLRQIERCWYAKELKGERLNELIAATRRRFGSVQIWGTGSWTVLEVDGRRIALDLAKPYEFAKDLERRRSGLQRAAELQT